MPLPFFPAPGTLKHTTHIVRLPQRQMQRRPARTLRADVAPGKGTCAPSQPLGEGEKGEEESAAPPLGSPMPAVEGEPGRIREWAKLEPPSLSELRL
jgi:hypothetical protein